MTTAHRIRSLVLSLSAILLFGVSADPAAAQVQITEDGAWAIFVTPRIGWMQPGAEGPLEGWRPEGLRIVGGPVGGIAIELRTPLPWVSLRATIDQSVRNNLGFGSGDTGGWNPFTDPYFLSRASALQSQYSIGGLIRPIENSPVRPVGVVGVGVRHWNWNPGSLAESLVPRFPETRWDRSWHFGGGVEADAEPLAVRFEVLEYRTRAEGEGGRRVGLDDRYLMLTLEWIGFR